MIVYKAVLVGGFENGRYVVKGKRMLSLYADSLGEDVAVEYKMGEEIFPSLPNSKLFVWRERPGRMYGIRFACLYPMALLACECEDVKFLEEKICFSHLLDAKSGWDSNGLIPRFDGDGCVLMPHEMVALVPRLRPVEIIGCRVNGCFYEGDYLGIQGGGVL